MDYSVLAIGLLFLGLGLLIAEIFIPSGGILLTLTIVSLGGSVWCAWLAWWKTEPAYWWLYVGSSIVLIPTVIGVAFYIFPRTSFGRRVLLEGPSLEEVTPYVREQQHLSEMIGKVGKTLSMFNPGGIALIEGERFHCETQGMVLDPGEPVQVVAVKGNRLVLKQYSGTQPSAAPVSSDLDLLSPPEEEPEGLDLLNPPEEQQEDIGLLEPPREDLLPDSAFFPEPEEPQAQPKPKPSPLDFDFPAG